MMMPEDTVQAMQPGSVIVDLAAETGGNCQLSVAGETIQRYGVTIMGPVNLPATMAFHASEMYAKNVSTLLEHLAPKGQFTLNLDDDITKGVCLTRDGEILYGPTKNWLKEQEGVACTRMSTWAPIYSSWRSSSGSRSSGASPRPCIRR